jgi:hypothetical protein
MMIKATLPKAPTLRGFLMQSMQSSVRQRANPGLEVVGAAWFSVALVFNLHQPPRARRCQPRAHA